jgi:signal transduction histidine kinase
MLRERAQWAGTPLLVGLSTLSVSISVYHLLAHQAPLLPTILGQWSLLALSLVLCGSVYYALTVTESGAERLEVGLRAAAIYAVAAVASSGYAIHQYLTPEAVLPYEAIAFQATFVAVAGGIAGVFLGLEKVRRDRTVSELRSTTQQLEWTVDQLDRSNEQLQEFAYVAAHDLQEPARMVATYVDLLAAEQENGESTAEYLEFAEDGAREMLSMIDALQNYYEITTRETTREPVDTTVVLTDVLDTLEPQLRDADVTMRTEELPTVEGDATQLEAVFEQLLENALEHGTDVSEIQVSASRSGDEYRFAVSDDGVDGVTGDPEKLFRIFGDAGEATDGPGVGLAVCELVVDRHRGEIWIESEAGETTVRFTIPVEGTRPTPPALES